jgi:hypothetical protein
VSCRGCSKSTRPFDRPAVDGLRQAAVAEDAQKYQQLADQLAHHAQTEEEVLYPTAILVGDVLRARQAAK